MRLCFSKQCEQDLLEKQEELRGKEEEIRQERSRSNLVILNSYEEKNEIANLKKTVSSLEQRLMQQKLIPCVQCRYSDLGPNSHPAQDPASVGIKNSIIKDETEKLVEIVKKKKENNG